MSKEAEVKTVEDRLPWIQGKIQSSFKAQSFKADVIKKAFADAANIQRIKDFLDGDSSVISFYGDTLTCTTGIPKKINSKSPMKVLVFIKLRPGKIENIKNDVLVQEMGAEPLIHLEKLLSEVYIPLLSNSVNQEGWGEVASKEIVDRLHSFLANVSITVSSTRGETCLPLPPLNPNTTNTKGIEHLLENAVITWTKQINGVLKTDPESQLKAGLHPTPESEIEFWKTKAANLNAIHDQLWSERVLKLLAILDSAKSTYCPPFSKLCKEVFAAREEANDNVKYLLTLEPWFDKLSRSLEYESLSRLFRPIMHIITLIWKNSRFYNNPARLVVLVREICNAVIAQSNTFVTGKQVFDLIDARECNSALQSLRVVIRTCEELKKAYLICKQQVASECPHNPWRIQNSALFMRLDAYLKRAHDVYDLTVIVDQYSKLANLCIGGSKGKQLTATLMEVLSDFDAAIQDFAAVPYDILNVDAVEFDSDLATFHSKLLNIERRLASVFSQAFNDCSTVFARLKLLDSFESLLGRPHISEDIEEKHLQIVRDYTADLKVVYELFLSERADPVVSANMPPISGALSWAQTLLRRAREPLNKIIALGDDVTRREVFKEVQKIYNALKQEQSDYEALWISEWSSTVEKSSLEKLKLPLLVRRSESSMSLQEVGLDGRLLAVNFDSALVRLLREVKYFLALNLEVPPSALEIYKRAETLRQQTGNLDLIVNMYNHIARELLPVEAPLLRQQLVRIDEVISRGLKELDWRSPSIDSFISDTHNLVKASFDMLSQLKSNMRDIFMEMENWYREPLLTRKAKPMTIEEFQSMYKSSRDSRYAAITNGGKIIMEKVKASQAVMKVAKGSANWAAYIDFVNSMAVQGLAKLVMVSLQKLGDLISAEKIRKAQDLPLLVIELKMLPGEGVVFAPDIKEDSSRYSLYDIVSGWVDSFFHAATLFKRMDDNEGQYIKEMTDNVEVQRLLSHLFDTLSRTEASASEFLSQYSKYAYLWEKNLQSSFTEFCDKAYVEIPLLQDRDKSDRKEEREGAAPEGPVEDEPHATLRIPDLPKFESEILRYKDVQEAIIAMKTPVDLGWLRINASPVKSSLVQVVQQLSNLYTSHLKNFIIDEITRLYNFESTVTAGLDAPISSEVVDENGEVVTKQDPDALRKCMEVIRDAKKLGPACRTIIEPLKETVLLLKRRGVSLDDARIKTGSTYITVVEFLEQAEMRLERVFDKSYQKKEDIFPSQNRQMESIKKRAEQQRFDAKAFCARVRNDKIFTPEEFRYHPAPGQPSSGPNEGPGLLAQIDAAYDAIDAYHRQLLVWESEILELNETLELYELPVTTLKELTECKAYLRVFKQLWDHRALMAFTHESWKGELWSELNTTLLEDSNKKISEAHAKIADTHHFVRNLAVFKDTERKLADISITLPLINSLHDDSMQTRHWNELAVVCGQRSLDPTDPKFCLEDMLSLNLHLKKDAVHEIVEKATEELKIEKNLRIIQNAWAGFNLEYVQHKDTDVMIPKASDEILEALDGHQMDLQGMYSKGKYKDHFEATLTEYQQNLRMVEENLKEWLHVSQNWVSLEAIFLASADIRSQLPEDTKRFEGIDKAFKELMKSAIDTPNVLQSCTNQQRGDALKEMSKHLESCQRSLNEYLDMKKKIFPRFYFVSNVALLDILSNGNNPPRIMKYVGDCYDSITDLHFLPPAQEGGISNQADKMVSKDGEIVQFHRTFTMTGAVENWLNDLTVMQQDSLRELLAVSMEGTAAWDVDPTSQRHRGWIDNAPAQIALVGSQIVWSEDVQRALDDLEGGQEDSVKKYLAVCNERLNALISRVLEDLDPMLRTKIISLITLDVHARDVVQKLIDTKAEGPSSFMWSQQLRFEFLPHNNDVNIAITDFRSKYSYEYIGNSGRLVITPLTDRCYITLTLALRLFLGGAPAGPAGTGKTETTKDLARALALPCYVFNCSDQMNFQTMADIFKGLAQTGAWGCFDEFNRINIEVLSVVATQVKSILDAAVLYSDPANREPRYASAPAGTPPCVVGSFELNGDEITLIPTCGMFITMNPGYAGRTELPENLKALFRSCAMIRPDLALICENMLMSEGFTSARPLSIKFVTLYQLSSELLSPQAHYDWGLRSVKSVLRVAGSLKRADPAMKEEDVLMRALRDFNTPKMPLSDLPIFLRLIADLFPSSSKIEPKVNETIRRNAIEACKAAKLQFDPGFVAKVVQLQELMDVRHSVMLLGPGGCGKTTVWKALAGAHNLNITSRSKQPCIYDVVDPKAVTSNELYGYMTLAKEWKDGCLSIIMRGMSKNTKELGYFPHQTYKWAVLDGDIDAVWIESMNTVMDDNKMLTLVSNERIPLSASMRMVFEINSLANATPATVSRAGILFINESDIGWRPYMETWLHSIGKDIFLAHLPALFDKYIESLYESTRKLRSAVPILLISQVVTVCRLMEGFLERIPDVSNCLKPVQEMIECFFFEALVWAFGGPLIVEVTEGGGAKGNHRKTFHEILTALAPNVKLPKECDGVAFTVYDFFYNPTSGEFENWTSRVPKYVPVPIGNEPGLRSFSSITVDTVDTVRLSALGTQLVLKGFPVMFVGTAGTGKTNIVRTLLSNLPDHFTSTTVTMNYYMDSAALQQRIDGSIEKRSGRLFGPPTGKKHVLFMDDLNLPYIETYGTQNSLSLLRQIMDHKQYYDRDDLGFRKDVVDVQFMAAMNPTAGSFSVTERLQRNFSTFATLIPSDSDLSTIFRSILVGHLSSFQSSVQVLADAVTEGTIKLHKLMLVNFLPDAERISYNWNMRELGNVFQGLSLAKGDYYQTPEKFLRLWVHELYRVFCDRLVDQEDVQKFEMKLAEVLKATIKDSTPERLMAKPLNFTNFVGQPATETAYLPVPDTMIEGESILKRTVKDKLAEYNTSNPIMKLELFDEAVDHVCRITRILSSPGGNALLVGVGGSGKQSLARLASFICGFSVRQLAVTARFGVNELKEALKAMYTAAAKDQGIVFLLTDSQIINDKFLVYINDILASGWVSDLFARDEFDTLIGLVRNDAKSEGVEVDSPEAIFGYLLARIRVRLHVILCCSPVGPSLRVRARRFPGLVNCTVIDKYHPWPREALISVASTFLADVNLGSDEVKTAVAEQMSDLHMSVNTASNEFLEKLRRYNYVTPKSFLELIAFYKLLLAEKRDFVNRDVGRLSDGLAKLEQTSRDVADLVEVVKAASHNAAIEVKNTNELMAQMAQQEESTNIEKAKADEIAQNAREVQAEAQLVADRASAAKAAAQPIMDSAKACLSELASLQSQINTLKALPKPPEGLAGFVLSGYYMINGIENKNAEKWEVCKTVLDNVVPKVMNLAEQINTKPLPDAITSKVRAKVGTAKSFFASDVLATLPKEDHDKFIFDLEVTHPVWEAWQARGKALSAAAASFGASMYWLYQYNKAVILMIPLREDEARAKAEEERAGKEAKAAQDHVDRLNVELAKLAESLVAAEEKRNAAEAESKKCQERLDLANRLVNGLSSEYSRWSEQVQRLKQTESLLIGDVLLSAGFISYLGAFDNSFRRQLWESSWIPDIRRRQIPLSEGADPLATLTTESKTTEMLRHGLPADRISIENGSIIKSSKRWPLIIDPQLQGIKWLKKQEEGALVLQLSQNNWLKSLTEAVSNGRTVIIENISEELDATLDPVIARAVFQKGRNLFIQIGGEDVEYNPNFRLYLQTNLSNPHYRPEIQAQCTLVNFIATEAGLQDQLLARAVKEERPELEKQKQDLQEKFNSSKLRLLELEDNLLTSLANAPADILSDIHLIESLEQTKSESVSINEAVQKGMETEQEINFARQVYVPLAEEGAMLYFMITQLSSINHMYQFSLDSYVLYFYKAIREAAKNDDVRYRVEALRETLRKVIYTWVSRGMFESDKIILLCQLTLQLMGRRKLPEAEEFVPAEFQFLLRGPKMLGEALPAALEWLPEAAWNSLQALASMLPDFSRLPLDLIEAPARFKDWFTHTTPESEKLPLDWASLDKTPFKKLLVLRCMRPDRIMMALKDFVSSTLPNGKDYVECDATLNSLGVLEDTFKDSSPTTPLYFILSPGADVVSDVEKLAKGTTTYNISMGQGQDKIAMERLEQAHKQGHWVILNNVHLMPRWLIELEKKLDTFAQEGSHERFRVFMTSEASTSIPIGILSRSIKLTNEPPQGLKANLKRAFATFQADVFNELDSKLRSIVFGLSFFHAVMIERKKFGPKGFNMMYPFAVGDLRDSVVCLRNYMENSSGRVPWEDLRYIFGQIVYGGHIVNDFDRLLCVSYLDHFLKDELLDEMELFPFVKDEKGATFKSPNPTTFQRYLEHIDTEFKGDTPLAFGLHPNAEIGFRTDQSESLLRLLLELQPRDGGSGSADDKSPRAIASAALVDFMETFQDTKWDLDDITSMMEEPGPFQNVLILELKYLNVLTAKIRESLGSLKLGFDGKLTMSDAMERLETELSLDRVPSVWQKLAWPSLRSLGSWKADLVARVAQLNDWISNPSEIPKITWLGGFVNPQSFLTAVRQQTAQRNNLELDKLAIYTEISKKGVDDIETSSRDGAYIKGLYMQGARFDAQGGIIEKSRPREMYCEMPVINVRSVPIDKLDTKGIFECPVYKTSQRGPTYVFSAQLKTKAPPARWVMAGACLVFDTT